MSYSREESNLQMVFQIVHLKCYETIIRQQVKFFSLVESDLHYSFFAFLSFSVLLSFSFFLSFFSFHFVYLSFCCFLSITFFLLYYLFCFSSLLFSSFCLSHSFSLQLCILFYCSFPVILISYSFQVGHPPLCHFFCSSICPSVHCAPYLRNCTSSNHNFWYTCVK